MISLVCCLFVVGLFVSAFATPTSAAANQTLNFQSKIVNKTTGLNITNGTPSCVVAGADTCDFRASIYSDPSGGTLLWQETHSNAEIGSNNGIINLSLNSVCNTWTACGGSGLTWGSDPTVYLQIEFDTDGNGDFVSAETFSRTLISSTAYALYADVAGSVSGGLDTVYANDSDKTLNINNTAGLTFNTPNASVTSGVSFQITNSDTTNNPLAVAITNAADSTALRVTQSGNTTSPLLVANETGAGTPNLLELQVGGTPVVSVSNTGLLTGTGGATVSGAAINLNANSNFAVNIGTGTSTGAVTIGGTGTQAIAIGNGAGVKTVSLGSSNTTSTTTLLSGSGGLLLNDSNNQPTSIGTGTSTGTVTLGGTGTQTIAVGNGAGVKTVNLGSSNTTSTTTILSGSGAVNINVNNNQPTNIGSGTTTGTVTIGGTGTQTIALGNGAGVKTVNLGSTNTTSTTNINSGSGAVNINASNNQPTNIGTGTTTGTVTLGGTGTQTLSIGNGAGVKTVNLGSSNTTSTTTILSGSGGLALNVNNNQPTNIGTGTTTGTVSVGGNANSVAIDSSTWDINAAGAASGFTALTSSGTITFSGLNVANGFVRTNGSGVLSSSALVAADVSGLAVLFTNGSTQSTSSTASLIDMTTTGNVPTPLIRVNENGAGTPILEDLQVAGSSVFTVANNGDVTTTGNTAVNGGSLTTTAGTAAVFNTGATTLNVGGAATAVNVGASSGTTTINNNLSVTGNTRAGTATNTAFLNVSAATTAEASMRLVSSAGTNPTTPNSGDMWWNGTNLDFYNGTTTVDLLTNATGNFVNFIPGSTQSTTSTNSLINIATTGNTSNALIVANENGAGTPNLLNLQVAGTNKLQVLNDGTILPTPTVADGSTTTTGTGTSRSITVSSSANFDVGNLVLLNGSTYGLITSIPNGTTVRISVATSWTAGQTLVEYTAPDIGSGANGQNRYSNGYFLNGVTTGIASTVYKDELIDSKNNALNINTTNNQNVILGTGNLGVNVGNPTAYVDIAGSTTSKAALRIEAGSNPTTPNAGDVWFNGTNFNFYTGSTTIDLLANAGGTFINFTPSGAQSTSSTNSLLNVTTTANTANTLLIANENGAGTPNLLDLQVAGTSQFLVSNNGNITTTGNVAVNGGSITTTQTTGNLYNTTATTVNIAGAATVVSIGAGTGTTTVNNGLSVGGNLRAGTATNTAFLDVAAATTAQASMRIVSSAGTNPTTPNSGDVWWNGTNLNFYNGSTTVDLLTPGAGTFVNFAPASQQSTSSTNSLVNVATTGNTANALIIANENGAGTPNLLSLQVGGTPVVTVSNSGALTAVGVDSGAGLVQGTGGLTITGTVNVNNNAGTNTTNIGTGTTTGTVTIGGTGTQTIAIGNGAGAKTVNVGSTNTTSTTNINSGSGGVLINDSNNQPISVGTGTSTGTITLGGTGTQTISIGNGAGAKTLNLGSSNTTSTTNLLSGSGGLNINVNNNQTTNIGTGTTTANVNIGGGANQIAINSSTWDISGAGAATGLTGITSSGTITFSGLSVAGGIVRTNGSGVLSSSVLSASDIGTFGFVQNGNSFGATATLGTNDANNLAFETNNVTRAYFDTTGDLNFDSQGSTDPNVFSKILFTNTAGTGDFRIGADGGDIFWQGGGGRNLQMGAFWGMDLIGYRQTAGFPTFVAGAAAYNTRILNQTQDVVALIVQGFTTQTNDLVNFRNSAGTTLGGVSGAGNMFLGATAATTNQLYVAQTAAATSTSAQQINYTQAANAANITGAGLVINATGSAQAGDTLYGVQFGNFTGTAATEYALQFGTGWDKDINFTDTTVTVGVADDSELNIVNATGVNLMTMRDYNNNFGATFSAGAFIDRNSALIEDFNKFRTTLTADTTGAAGAAHGDGGGWGAYENIGTGCTFSTLADTVNGIERIQENAAGTGCLLMIDEAATNPRLNFAAANLPILLMKMRPSNVGANNTFFAGLSLTTDGTIVDPTSFIGFTNNGGTTWTGRTTNASTSTNVVCTGQTISTTQFALMMVEVRSTTDVHFFIDADVSNGISFTECGTGSATNIPTANLGAQLMYQARAGGTANQQLDVDFFRAWQDDNTPRSAAPVNVNGLAANYSDNSSLAQFFPADDLNTAAATLVTLDKSVDELKVKPSDSAYDENTVGVVVGRGLDIGNGSFDGIRVAIAGRSEVFATNENGDIKPGDYVTSGSVTGSVMKATKAGYVIGQALTALSNGKIVMSIKPAYYNGVGLQSIADGLTQDINLTAEQLVAAKPLHAEIGENLLAVFANNKQTVNTMKASEVFTDRVAAAIEIITPKVLADQIFTNEIVARDGDLAITIGDNNSLVIRSKSTDKPLAIIDSAGNATFTGTVTADKLQANQIQGLELLVDSLKSQIQQGGQVAGLSTNSGSLNKVTISSAQITLDLNVLGQLNAKGGIVVMGNATFNGDVEFGHSPLFAKDSGGYAIIKKDTDSVQIKYSQPISQVPLVVANIVSATPTTSGTVLAEDIKYVVTEQSGAGFTIKLNKTATFDIKFNWVALIVKDPTTTESKPVVVPTAPVEPTTPTDTTPVDGGTTDNAGSQTPTEVPPAGDPQP